MSNQQKNTTNLLFSPGNDFNLGSGTFLLPQHQNSPMMVAEEDSFVGQSPSNLFNQSNNASDPFANVGIQSLTSSTIASNSEHEPQLFVPPSTTPPPAHSHALNNHTNPTFAAHTPQSFQTPPPTMHQHQNPYRTSHSGGPATLSSPYLPAPGMTPSSSRIPHAMPPPLSQQPTAPPPSVATPPNIGLPSSFSNLASTVRPPPMHSYNSNVVPHWCYSKTGVKGNLIWYPFSYSDSNNLEKAFEKGANECIQTDGGRYDVFVSSKTRKSVYWQEPESSIRRCTWYFKTDDAYRYVPYEADFANKIEEEYKTAIAENKWQKQVKIDDKNIIVFHNPQVMVHLQPLYEDNHETVISDKQMASKIIKRGIADIDLANEIPENEIGIPDHLVLIVLGIGPSCENKNKSIVEYVDEFRAIQLGLLKSHFKNALENKSAARIEFLPVHWYHALLGDASNVEQEIRNLTLPSITRLRQHSNESMLDTMFYTSPVYCQTIADTVGSELNSMFNLFNSRNPGFCGNVSLVGHSLGSLVLFDLISHQADAINDQRLQKEAVATPIKEDITQSKPDNSPVKVEETTETLESLLQKLNLTKFEQSFSEEQIDIDSLMLCAESDLKDIGVPLGPRKKLMGYIKEIKSEAEKKQAQAEAAAIVPQVENVPEQNAEIQRMESVTSFFSSAMNVRVDYQQFDCGAGQPLVRYPVLDFKPTAFFAIGSPIGLFLTLRGTSELGFDFTVGECRCFYNVFHPFDPLAYRIEPLINPEINMKPALVPHHKGRKRMHLQLQESLGRMGIELKQGIINSVRKAMGSLQRYWNQSPTADEVEEQVSKVTAEILQDQNKNAEVDDTASVISDNPEPDAMFGNINNGKRVDYVLQERPLESFNDYLFAFQSHNCYWTSEDTALLIMKEVYTSLGVDSDRQVEKNRRLQLQQQQQQMGTSIAPPPLN